MFNCDTIFPHRFNHGFLAISSHTMSAPPSNYAHRIPQFFQPHQLVPSTADFAGDNTDNRHSLDGYAPFGERRELASNLLNLFLGIYGCELITIPSLNLPDLFKCLDMDTGYRQRLGPLFLARSSPPCPGALAHALLRSCRAPCGSPLLLVKHFHGAILRQEATNHRRVNRLARVTMQSRICRGYKSYTLRIR